MHGRASRETDSKCSTPTIRDLSCSVGRILRQTEKPYGIIVECRSGGREPNTAGVPLQKLDTEFFFEFLNLTAQRRLGDVKANGCTTEVEFFRYGHETANLLECEHGSTLEQPASE